MSYEADATSSSTWHLVGEYEQENRTPMSTEAQYALARNFTNIGLRCFNRKS